jgi:hypothetical protein
MWTKVSSVKVPTGDQTGLSEPAPSIPERLVRDASGDASLGAYFSRNGVSAIIRTPLQVFLFRALSSVG